MHNRFYNVIFIVFLCLAIVNCANRGTPSGGEKDETPPEIIKTIPENYSTGFNTDEIRIYFDEYIKIKDLQKNLIISPPMDPEPEITPLGSASKYITIKIQDTLLANTTYAINFGESIVDNNEENPYPFYRYIFSTGTYIDSLKVNGVVLDALKSEPEEFVTVMLYEIDSTFTDSIIYKEKPKYITNTLDSTSTFQIDNIKAGTYLLAALKDENNNYKYEQKNDKIGFVGHPITVPNDTIFAIKLFKETLDFKASRAGLISGQKIAFGYEGDHEKMKIKLLSQGPGNHEFRITKDPKTDTLYYWFKPKIEADSLVFEVANRDYKDSLTVRIKEVETDSLQLKQVQSGVLQFTEDFEIESNIPLEAFDDSKMTFIDKDSAAVSYTISKDTLLNRLIFKFNKTESNSYNFKMLPGTFTDFFGNTNADTLTYNLSTREYSDYGNLRLTLENATYPVIVQLVDQRDQVKVEKISTKPEPLDFRHLQPGTYSIRVIFDSNNNGKYDPGIYLLKKQPERVSYYPTPLDIRAGWDLIETFTLLED